jgi:hypothetical protein
MLNFVLINNDGYIVQSGTCPFQSDLVLQQEANPDLTLLEIDAKAGKDYIKNGVAKEYPPRPDKYHEFDFAAEQWVDPRSQEQINAQLMDDLRVERDKLLSESDWTQVPDAPVDQAAWAAYRQALRDLPENTTDPANPVWPTKPQ